MVAAEYRVAKPSRFLFSDETYGLDGRKLGEVQNRLAQEGASGLSPAERAVHEANVAGDRRTLKVDALIPAALAVIYLVLLFYFKAAGGYRQVRLETEPA